MTMTPDERIAALETGQHQLSQDIHTLSSRFDAFSTEVRNILRDHNKTPWSVLVSALGVVITIGVLTFAPVYKSLGTQEKLFEAHRQTDGHPAMEEKVDVLKDEVIRLREKLDDKLEVQITRDDIDRELRTINDRLDKIGKFVVDEIRANAANRAVNGNGH